MSKETNEQKNKVVFKKDLTLRALKENNIAPKEIMAARSGDYSWDLIVKLLNAVIENGPKVTIDTPFKELKALFIEAQLGDFL